MLVRLGCPWRPSGSQGRFDALRVGGVVGRRHGGLAFLVGDGLMDGLALFVVSFVAGPGGEPLAERVEIGVNEAVVGEVIEL